MAWRWRCHLRFTSGSGYAAWGRDQLNARLDMAFHVRPGLAAQELSVVTADTGTGVLDANIFWPDDQEALAIDTRTLFTDAGVLARLRADEPVPGGQSWMTYHYCLHDLDPPQPCSPSTVWRWPA